MHSGLQGPPWPLPFYISEVLLYPICRVVVLELSGICSHFLFPHHHIPMSCYDIQEGTLVLASEEVGLELLFGFLFEIPYQPANAGHCP